MIETPATQSAPLAISTVSCGPLEDATPQALGLTYWFDAPVDGPVIAVTVRFNGHRLGVQGLAGAHDRFDMQTTVAPVHPGSGRVSVTTRLVDLAAGDWQVFATPLAASDTPPGRRLPKASGRGKTAFAPVVRVRAPGVRLGAWPALVLLGTVLGLATQTALARSRDESSLLLLAITLVACVVGVIGAKVYYLATHRRESTSLLTVGMSVQGFVIGCIGTLVLGSLATGLSIGLALDLTAPGLLLGMTVGRLGCFFGGCCAGRPTASRWGLWSSDRRLGTRRIPVQLMESAMAGLVFSATALIVSTVDLPIPGLAFVGGLSAYILGRQLLFPLRDLPRKTAHGRRVTMAIAAALTLLATAAALVL